MLCSFISRSLLLQLVPYPTPIHTRPITMAKDAELKEEKKKKRKSDVADLDVEEKKSKKEKRKSLAADDEKPVSATYRLACAPVRPLAPGLGSLARLTA